MGEGDCLYEKCIITYLREQMTLYCFTFVIFLLQGSRMICNGKAGGEITNDCHERMKN